VPAVAVIAGITLSTSNLFVVPPSVEIQIRTAPAVVLLVPLIVILKILLPIPAADAEDGPEQIKDVVVGAVLLVSAVVTCETSITGVETYCAVVAIVSP
jgi:hypothetical protein